MKAFLGTLILCLSLGGMVMGQVVLEAEDGFYGFDDDLVLASPLTGRANSCQAKLDVCFRPNLLDYNGLTFSSCIDSCDSIASKPSCSRDNCVSRCVGLFGLGSSCDSNTVTSLSDDPATPDFLVQTSTGFIGITGNHLSSPVNGRQRACEARLDVCFGPGHKEVPGGFFACLDACQLGPGSDNVACTLEACESRCEAFFGFSDSCF